MLLPTLLRFFWVELVCFDLGFGGLLSGARCLLVVTFLFPPRLLVLGVLEDAKLPPRLSRCGMDNDWLLWFATCDSLDSFAFGISRISRTFGSEFLSMTLRARFCFVMVTTMAEEICRWLGRVCIEFTESIKKNPWLRRTGWCCNHGWMKMN